MIIVSKQLINHYFLRRIWRFLCCIGLAETSSNVERVIHSMQGMKIARLMCMQGSALV